MYIARSVAHSDFNGIEICWAQNKNKECKMRKDIWIDFVCLMCVGYTLYYVLCINTYVISSIQVGKSSKNLRLYAKGIIFLCVRIFVLSRKPHTIV